MSSYSISSEVSNWTNWLGLSQDFIHHAVRIEAVHCRIICVWEGGRHNDELSQVWRHNNYTVHPLT